MIKADSGRIELRGTKIDILADFVQIVKALTTDICDWEDVEFCIETAKRPDDAIRAEVNEINEKMETLLKGLFGSDIFSN